MNDIDNKTKQLLDKLAVLMEKQQQFGHEIEELRKEIQLLSRQKEEPETAPPLTDEQREQLEIIQKKAESFFIRPTIKKPKRLNGFSLRADLENFIGENLISRIGIIITVIGVGIGVKYSIEHQLISPVVRILLGYLLGFILMTLAFYLKKNYLNFSAVLLSGSMAIIYFITYAAYRFYELLPAEPTFGLMVVITGITVYSALSYNRQVIAHIGMVGAYAVPFLLSDNSGRVVILFSYMAIINAGILILAIKKYWKPLFYASFLITWLIFVTWFYNEFDVKEHAALAWIFSSLCFVFFYLEFLACKLLKNERFVITDIMLLLANSAVFYGIGYLILQDQKNGEDYQGLFTLANACIHAIAALAVQKRQHPDTNLYYFLTGLVITFLTIMVPVQLDGNWIPVLWSMEAAFLFWIGRTKNITSYEVLSYAVLLISFAALFNHWQTVYHTGASDSADRSWLFFNINFLVSMISGGSYVLINLINRENRFLNSIKTRTDLFKAMNIIIPGILFLALYLSIYLEINQFWEVLYNSSGVYIEKGTENERLYYNENYLYYKTIMLYLYTFLYFTTLNAVNIQKIRSSLLGQVSLGFGTLTILLFLVQGLSAIGRLRLNYLHPALPGAYQWGTMDIGIRYVVFLFFSLLLFSMHRYLIMSELRYRIKIAFGLFLHFTILVLLGNELVNWVDIFSFEPSYKLALSILFGLYSLFLVVLGIWKKKTYLRIAAIVLFSATLLKLFFYDLSHLSTLAKTVVFISLGLLLLLISFLYVRFRHLIRQDVAEEMSNRSDDRVGPG